MEYDDLDFKIPQQSNDYDECSAYVVERIEKIVADAIQRGENRIFINTNLKLGLPMENINKVAGPFVEAWAVETFCEIAKDSNNKFQLVGVGAQERLHMADVILQFKKDRGAASGVTAEVDVKATAEDIKSSGKSPNITSFGRIRTAYIADPDYIFIILSLKHRVFSTRNSQSGLMDGVMEVTGYNAYDLKFLSSKDISYNPSLGTGQIQVRDIHYVEIVKRNVWEFCQMLDKKYLASRKRSFSDWYELAKHLGWIKVDDE
jgi:hypothetical protein